MPVPMGVTTVGDVLASGLSPFPLLSALPRMKSLQEVLPAVPSGSRVEPSPASGTPELAEVTGVSKPIALQASTIPLTCSASGESPLSTAGTLIPPPIAGLPSTPPVITVAETALPISTQPSSGVTGLGTDHTAPLSIPTVSYQHTGPLSPSPSSGQGGGTQFGRSTPSSTPPPTQTWRSLASINSHSMPVRTLTSIATSMFCVTSDHQTSALELSSPHAVSWTTTRPVATPLPLPSGLSLPQTKGHTGAAPASGPGVQGSPSQATGTLQSPTKPAQEFVNVEHFLVPAATSEDKAGKEKEEEAISNPCAGTVQLPASEDLLEVSFSGSHQPTHLSPPSGVLCLPQTFRAPHIIPPQHSVPFTRIVNQQPIPSAAEHALRNPTRTAPLAFVPPALSFPPSSSLPTSTFLPTSYGVINPNLFLAPAGPSQQPMSPSFLFSNSHGAAVYPFDSGIVLPSASMLCPRAPGSGCDILPAYLPDAASSLSFPNEERKEISPPKRPRLE